MMMRSAFYYTNTLNWIFIVLAHLNNSPWIDLPHSDTLSLFRANQSLLFLLNAACLAERQQIPFLYDPTIYRTQGEHANHYTTYAVPKYGTSLE